MSREYAALRTPPRVADKPQSAYGRRRTYCMAKQPSCAPSDAQTVALAYRTNYYMNDITGNSVFDINIII